MKLGVSSPLRHDSPEQWALKHKELGLEAINFSPNCEDDPALIEKYVKEARAQGFTIAEVGIWRRNHPGHGLNRKICIAGLYRIYDFTNCSHTQFPGLLRIIILISAIPSGASGSDNVDAAPGSDPVCQFQLPDSKLNSLFSGIFIRV